MKKILISTFVLIILSGCAYLGNAHYNDLFKINNGKVNLLSCSNSIVLSC